MEEIRTTPMAERSCTLSIHSFLPLKMPGPALIVVWSKALPLTPSCLSLLSGLESQPEHDMRKLPVTWCKAVVSAGYSGFLQQLQLASHELVAIWQKE